jgi:hypothetical protein
MISLSDQAYRLSTRIIKIQVICLLALILALPTGVWAKPTTPEQARTAVENWLALEATPLGAPLGRQIKEVKASASEEAGTAVDKSPGLDATALGPQIKEVKTYNHQDITA